MFKSWFNKTLSAYNGFVKALLVGDIESMNEYMNRVTRGVISYYMNKVALATFSYFDTGKNPSDEAPERFYHGLVIEFKVFNAKKEKTLDETVENALKQIKEKKYDTLH